MKKWMILISCCLLLSGCNGMSSRHSAIKRASGIQIEVSSMSLFMVGDALLHGAVYHQVKQPDGSYDFGDMMSVLKDITPQYDLRFYNQETILGGTELGLSSYPMFNSPQEFGDTMMSYGFNLVSLANNHTLDKGENGVRRSLDYWSQQNAMTAGSYGSWEERAKINIDTVNGISYTLLAYTYGTNGLIAPAGKEYLCNTYTQEMLIEDIQAVKDQVDVLIVSMHWGVEYTHTPTKHQHELAQLLADQGVHVIIGHHPHVIQPVERIKDAIVYYSLGNLVSAQDGIMRNIGMMGAVEIYKIQIGNKTLIQTKHPRADLIFTIYDAGYQNLRLETIEQLDPSYKNIYDDYIKIITRLDHSIEVGGIK